MFTLQWLIVEDPMVKQVIIFCFISILFIDLCNYMIQ